MRIYFYIKKAKIEKIKINTTLGENETKVFVTVTYCEEGGIYRAEVYKKYRRLGDAIRFIQSLDREDLYDIDGDYYEANEEDEERVLWYVTFDRSKIDDEEDTTI